MDVELVDCPPVYGFVPVFPRGRSDFRGPHAPTTLTTLPLERIDSESIVRMHIWRLVLVLLLSVAVPTYGLAAVGRHDDCPPQAGIVGAEKTAVASSCCDDMGGHEHDSNDACAQLCSLGGDCRKVNLLQTSITPEPGLTSHVRLRTGTPVHIAAFDCSGVWRPPRSF